MNTTKVSLDELNSAQTADFVRLLGNVFEGSPWIAESASTQRPFRSLEDLQTVLSRIVRQAEEPRKLALIGAHPELAAPADSLTNESRSEQTSASLDRLSGKERAAFAELNRRYRQKFGFPFVICVRRHGKQRILENFRARLEHSRDVEMNCAIEEICQIAYFRLQKLIA